MKLGFSPRGRIFLTPQNPYRTSKLTVAPATTFCPAAGDCETIMLAGVACGGGTATALTVESPFTSVEGAAATTPTFPNRNPSFCTVLLAVPKGCPTKLGITNACGSAGAVSNKLIL